MARDMMLTMDEYLALRRLLDSERESEGTSLSDRRVEQSLPPNKPRKVSRYHRELGRQWELLAKKHPRTAKKDLLGRAHTATRKALGMPRRRR